MTQTRPPFLQYHIEIRNLAKEDGSTVIVSTQYYKGSGCYTFRRALRFITTDHTVIKRIADHIAFQFPPEEYSVSIITDHFTPTSKE